MVGWHELKWNVVGARTFSFAARIALCGFLKLFRRRMILVPPRIRRPVNRRAVAAGRAALKPEAAVIAFPNADGMAVEFLLAMQTPMLLFEVRPFATHAVGAQQVQLFVVRQRNVFGHDSLRSVVAFSKIGPLKFNGRIVGIARQIIPKAIICSEPEMISAGV